MKRIETTSQLYLRRLVRELNLVGCVNGFFAYTTPSEGGTRCNRARVSNGVLEVREIGEDKWFAPSSDVFVDVNGRTVCASTVV